MQKVGAFGELRSQWMVAPVDSEVQRESLREKVVAFSDVVEHVVSVNGWLDIPPENLKPRPESQQWVHERSCHTSGGVHTDVHQHWTRRYVLFNGTVVLCG